MTERGPEAPPPARPLAAPPRSPHAEAGGGGHPAPHGGGRAARPEPLPSLSAMAGRGERGGRGQRGGAGGAGWARRAGGSCARCSEPSGRRSGYCFLPPLRAAPGAAHPFARQRRPISARRREAPANRWRARGRGRERARRSRGRAASGSRHFPERPQRALKGAAPRAEGRPVRGPVPVPRSRFLVPDPGPRLGRTGGSGSLRSPQPWAERVGAGPDRTGPVRVWAEASLQGRPGTIGYPRRVINSLESRIFPFFPQFSAAVSFRGVLFAGSGRLLRVSRDLTVHS